MNHPSVVVAILLVLAAFGFGALSGNALKKTDGDRMKRCVDGVSYLYTGRAIAPQIDLNGSPVACPTASSTEAE